MRTWTHSVKIGKCFCHSDFYVKSTLRVKNCRFDSSARCNILYPSSTLKLTKFLPHKIWVTVKFLDFHTVKHHLWKIREETRRWLIGRVKLGCDVLSGHSLTEGKLQNFTITILLRKFHKYQLSIVKVNWFHEIFHKWLWILVCPHCVTPFFSQSFSSRFYDLHLHGVEKQELYSHENISWKQLLECNLLYQSGLT